MAIPVFFCMDRLKGHPQGVQFRDVWHLDHFVWVSAEYWRRSPRHGRVQRDLPYSVQHYQRNGNGELVGKQTGADGDEWLATLGEATEVARKLASEQPADHPRLEPSMPTKTAAQKRAQALADKAALSTAHHVASLSQAVCHELELAYITRWLWQQDDSCRAAALQTAMDATKLLVDVYYRNR